jgi:hypothetical protein
MYQYQNLHPIASSYELESSPIYPQLKHELTTHTYNLNE